MDDPQAIAFGLAGIVLATYAIMWYANPVRHSAFPVSITQLNRRPR